MTNINEKNQSVPKYHFILYTNHRERILALSNEDAGKLIKAVFEFACDPQNAKPLYGAGVVLYQDIIHSIDNDWNRDDPKRGIFNKNYKGRPAESIGSLSKNFIE